jgi:hypothetical protein
MQELQRIERLGRDLARVARLRVAGNGDAPFAPGQRDVTGDRPADRIKDLRRVDLQLQGRVRDRPEAAALGGAQTLTRPSATLSQGESGADAAALTRSSTSLSETVATGDAQGLNRPPGALSPRERSAWIREHYTDERLAELMARYRAKFTEERIREGCDEGLFDPREV